MPTRFGDSAIRTTEPLNDADRWARMRERLGWNQANSTISLERLPFGPKDATAGSEIELQAVVVGDRATVDLPRTIDSSSYFANLQKRSAAQDTPKRALRNLERFLSNNPDRVWDNSWVRFPRRLLSEQAQRVFEHDLLSDKRRPDSGTRQDGHRFMSAETNEPIMRVPVSYLLKLALADVVGRQSLPEGIATTGRRMMQHFLSDNTSPESYSFNVVSSANAASLGRELSRETGLRFLATQLLAAYANDHFELAKRGQEVIVYFSPHPAIRQRQLNDCISDGFYRELFMSPCLSGWDQGEAKHDYMRLCHEVLSRSHLNAVAKVRDAGLVASNLVLLPSTSNISLANNGIHVSIGSKRIGSMMRDAGSGFGRAEEKAAGDLVIKIVEHFLPLFVGTYTCAPYRFDFADFHPERVLGFLPHELDFTHLRMAWRRWKKKARNSLCGYPVTGSGYDCVDRTLAAILRLKGDFVPDFRAIDYLIAPLSTDESPALDGTIGNTARLKRDLADQGVFDTRMSLYSFYRLRLFEQMGFSGFEARHYSLCEDLDQDLGGAVDLQRLITALAYKYVAEGSVAHADIPDDPTIESERRQIIFGGAIGLPTFFVGVHSGNQFLQRILAMAQKTRASRRYPGYQRIHQLEYRRALISLIRRDATDLIDALGLHDTISELEERTHNPARSAVGKVTGSILKELGVRDPFAVNAETFNRAAERFYRDALRRKQMKQVVASLREECRQESQRWHERWTAVAPVEFRHLSPAALLDRFENSLQANQPDTPAVVALLNLIIATVHADTSPESEAPVEVKEAETVAA